MDSTFAPLERRSKFAVAALVAVIAADLFSIWADVGEIRLMSRILEAEVPTVEEANASDTRVAIAGVLLLAAYVAAVVTFIVWFSRAYKNLPALGATGLRYGAGWSIGAWFVPFLNLFRPKQIANDIWRASDPAERPDQGINWREKPVPGFLTAWWVLWIISIYAANLTLRLYLSNDTPENIRRSDYADIGALVADIGAAALAIYVVRQVTRRQAERNRRMQDAPRPLPAPLVTAAPPA